MNKHLDLGCGNNPRNPFDAKEVYGVDISERADFKEKNIFFKKANVVTEDIPFCENYFDSISAYDFLEHIPRVVIDQGKTSFPFINLMNEIYRTLKNNGEFYAITPLYPLESAFVDPTHVNYITKNTFKYFCVPDVWAEMYGFKGKFKVLRVQQVNFEEEINKKISFNNILLNLFLHKRKQHIVWH